MNGDSAKVIPMVANELCPWKKRPRLQNPFWSLLAISMQFRACRSVDLHFFSGIDLKGIKMDHEGLKMGQEWFYIMFWTLKTVLRRKVPGPYIPGRKVSGP